MKMAEALAERKELQEKAQALSQRARSSATYQEGTKPLEDIEALGDEFVETMRAYTKLVNQINKTNAATELGEMITQRRVWKSIVAHFDAVESGMTMHTSRYSRNEIVMLPAGNVTVARNERDAFAVLARTIDLQIQQKNWEVDLME